MLKCSTIMSGGDIKRMILAKLVQAQRGLCALCDTAFRNDDPATIDHIKPLGAGGGGEAKNLQAAHWTCNNRRGSMPLAAWHATRSAAAAMPMSAPPAVFRHQKERAERPAIELAISTMADRIKFLERANALLFRDWQAATEKLRAIERIVGSTSLKGGVVEKLKQKLEAAETREAQG